MTTKQLDELYYQKKDIERLDEEIHILENDMQSVEAKEPRRYDSLLKKIVQKNNERAALAMQVEETEKFIKTLCHKDQLIIRYRYEERLSWQEVADKIGDGMSSESYAHRYYRVIKGAMP